MRAAACTKVPGQRSSREGPRPIQSQAGAQKGFPAPHPACSLVKAEGRAAGDTGGEAAASASETNSQHPSGTSYAAEAAVNGDAAPQR